MCTHNVGGGGGEGCRKKNYKICKISINNQEQMKNRFIVHSTDALQPDLVPSSRFLSRVSDSTEAIKFGEKFQTLGESASGMILILNFPCRSSNQ